MHRSPPAICPTLFDTNAARINAAIAGGCTLLTTETGIPHGGEPAPSYANIQRAGFAVAYPRPNLRRA